MLSTDTTAVQNSDSLVQWHAEPEGFRALAYTSLQSTDSEPSVTITSKLKQQMVYMIQTGTAPGKEDENIHNIGLWRRLQTDEIPCEMKNKCRMQRWSHAIRKV